MPLLSKPQTPQTRSLRPVAAVALLSVVAATFLAVTPPAYAASHAEKASSATVQRGKYLLEITGCHDCHTPMKMGAKGPEPDMSRMLSGHPEAPALPPAPKLPDGPWLVVSSASNTAWAGPWGTSYAANLTPDASTGMGVWTLQQFKATIKTGRHLGVGRPVLPPMPIPAYKNLKDADLDAIYAYLRTVPAVKNAVPPPLPPAPR
jgi:mono/diheme cytochrome c family protein